MTVLDSPPRTRSAVRGLLLDLLMVVVFATIGRRSHAEGLTVSGVAATALPFAAGTAAGWAACRGWRAPTSVVVTGVPVWAATVAGGVLLRRVSGQGAPASFVVVTTVVLAAFLLGWRAVAARRGH